MIRSPIRRSMFVLAVVGLLASSVAAPVVAKPPPGKGPASDSAVLFASDGMRQDLVEKYAAQGLMPTMASFLKHGASATGQRPADPGAAEHRRRLVHARDRRVAGRPRLDQQHVPHQRQPFANTHRRRSAPGVLQAESIAQAAERGGMKVAQVEWAGGAQRDDPGPDDRLPVASSRAAAWPRTSSAAGDAIFDDARSSPRSASSSTTPPAMPARRRSRRRADRRDRLDGNLPATYSPAQGDAPARARRQRPTSTASTPTSSTARTTARPTTTRSCSRARRDARRRGRRPRQGRARRRQGQDPAAAPSTARPAGMLVKVEELDPDLSQRPPVPHVGEPRAIATWPTWPGEPGFTGDFAEYLAADVPDLDRRRLRDPRGRASSARRPTSSRACTGRPATSRCSSTC